MRKILLIALCIAPRVLEASTGGTRGTAGLATAYRQHQRTTHYIVNTPDVDGACRARIFQCLVNYCGDVTVVPGQRGSRCTNASEGELYNYVLLCLQRDQTELLPNFATSFQAGGKGMNSAARLCPPYVQQELMAYLSMANMAEQLTKQRSDLCVQRRRELEAAMSCHQVALSSGGETHNRVVATLTDFCGAGVPGGSAEMVTRYSNAGNVGANIWGWAEKLVSLDMSRRGPEWQSAVDSVLAFYVNRMNLACGENMQLQTVARPVDTGPTNLQIAAVMAVGAAFPIDDSHLYVENPHQATLSLWHEVRSMTNVYDFATARQVVQAGLTNAPTTQNAFLTSATMGAMQTAYARGVKVMVLRDAARCYIIPVQPLNVYENSVLAQQLSNCRFN